MLPPPNIPLFAFLFSFVILGATPSPLISTRGSLLPKKAQRDHILPRQASTTPTFVILTSRLTSAGTYEYTNLNANGGSFYLGSNSTLHTYCPLTNQTLCPPGDSTALDVYDPTHGCGLVGPFTFP